MQHFWYIINESTNVFNTWVGLGLLRSHFQLWTGWQAIEKVCQSNSMISTRIPGEKRWVWRQGMLLSYPFPRSCHTWRKRRCRNAKSVARASLWVPTAGHKKSSQPGSTRINLDMDGIQWIWVIYGWKELYGHICCGLLFSSSDPQEYDGIWIWMGCIRLHCHSQIIKHLHTFHTYCEVWHWRTQIFVENETNASWLRPAWVTASPEWTAIVTWQQ